ncbi:hypothetical protein Ssi03_76990 [Sphaerisporangium siamense]|uniref:Helix-turn-helix domain-containing protein n=1 Tax=Sphaerisporangium siamense TaxID=795645 RepID=A0A7W7GF78_9ACTN|nr:hypothetical protein [Sphaerisporangium siamense]MBB4706149.1 hypothetical protein [Sphaerisporangium siamense]GII89709.1 hypothetical protein Ssi03_76990 [Sphaerisporangium siamense]
MAASTDTGDDVGAKQGEWNDVVRRARIGREKKLAMLMLSSYANSDGTSIYCGVARLAVDCGVSYRTAGRYLAWAREVTLLQMVKRGNHRKGRSDEYRLILGHLVNEKVTIPDPDAYRKLVGEIASANRADSKRRQSALPDQDDQDDAEEPSSTDTIDDRRSEPAPQPQQADLRTQGDRRSASRPDASTDTQTSVGTGFYGHSDTVSTDTPDVRPPSIDHRTSSTDLPWAKTDLRSARYPSARASDGDGQKQSSTRRKPQAACNRCGTVLDPDGTCFTCHAVPRPRTSPAS